MPKQLNNEFKQEAIKLVQQGRNVTDVARELGIHPNTIGKWIRLTKEYGENAFPGSGNLRPEDAELRKLKKRIADLEEENAILKKATAIFAKHQR